MAKRNNKPQIDSLTLDYQLAELPSSQHRAGLAGLVCIIRWLERQPDFKEKTANGTLCKLTRLDDLGASIALNQAGVDALFNEIYAANLKERILEKPKTKGKGDKKRTIPWKGYPEPKIRKDPKTGNEKNYYPYDEVIPAGSFLSDPAYDKSVEGKNGLWIKLWRDMVWSIFRGVPATRKPFEARAEGCYGDDATNVWKQITQPEDYTVDLPSTYFLGAQSSNAENVPFKDRVRLQFLLHFWLYAAQIYVPSIVDNEGKRNFVGYALAIPDIAKLAWFCDELPEILSDRSIEKSGYRPRDAVVDLAVASALDIMKRLRDRLRQTIGEQLAEDIVFGIDVIHVEDERDKKRREKKKPSLVSKLLIHSSTRLDPEEAMLDQYAQIRDEFWSPLFRKQCLLNLINYKPWYMDFDGLLCTLPYERTIEDSYFQRDVREKLKAILQEEKQMDETTPNSIETLIFRLVSNYVSRKLKMKYDLEWKKSEWKGLKNEALAKLPDYKKYSEMKMKVAKSAFLEVRSRTEQWDFIKYFTGTLCSVPQYMGTDSYVQLAKDLYDKNKYEKVRTLTLLALSANS